MKEGKNDPLQWTNCKKMQLIMKLNEDFFNIRNWPKHLILSNLWDRPKLSASYKESVAAICQLVYVTSLTWKS